MLPQTRAISADGDLAGFAPSDREHASAVGPPGAPRGFADVQARALRGAPSLVPKPRIAKMCTMHALKQLDGHVIRSQPLMRQIVILGGGHAGKSERTVTAIVTSRCSAAHVASPLARLFRGPK